MLYQPHSHTVQHPQPAHRELQRLAFQQPSEEPPQDQAGHTYRKTYPDDAALIEQVSNCLENNAIHPKGRSGYGTAQEHPDTTVKSTGAPIIFKNTSRIAQREFDEDGSPIGTSRQSLHLSREKGLWYDRREMTEGIILDVLDTMFETTDIPWSKDEKNRLSKINTIETPWGRKKGPLEDPIESPLGNLLPIKRSEPALEISPNTSPKIGKKSAIPKEERVLVAIDFFRTRPGEASKGPQINQRPMIGKGIAITATAADTHKDQPRDDLKLTELCLYVAILQSLEITATGTYDR